MRLHEFFGKMYAVARILSTREKYARAIPYRRDISAYLLAKSP
jgi:hypothetical protein